MCFPLRQDQREERSKVLTKYQFVNLQLDGKQQLRYGQASTWSSIFNDVPVSAEEKKSPESK